MDIPVSFTITRTANRQFECDKVLTTSISLSVGDMDG